jgi:hypothetical protein
VGKLSGYESAQAVTCIRPNPSMQSTRLDQFHPLAAFYNTRQTHQAAPQSTPNGGVSNPSIAPRERRKMCRFG